MNSQVIPIAVLEVEVSKQRKRQAPKGRGGDAVVAQVAAHATRHQPEGHIDYAAYRADGGYTLFKQCTSGQRDVESVIKTMEDSGLRGLGGAGFPAGRKWRIVRAEPAPRLMA